LNTASGRPCWFVTVFENQMDRRRELEAAGFTCQSDVGEDSWSKVLMARAAGEPIPRPALPKGFVVHPLAGDGEVEAYVELHQSVFESRNMTAAWRARTLRCPQYTPELDLVAATLDGRLAAFCVCWFHQCPQGASAQIEPLGVRADLRHLGLGRVILSEALRRAHTLGARQVYVETDKYRDGALGLYHSAGFRIVRDVLVYRKDYEGSANRVASSGGVVKIRKAKIEDSAGLAKVQVDSYRTAYTGIFPQAYLDQFSYEEQEQDWRDWIVSRSEDLLYVAEDATGEIVGYALARPGPREIAPYDSELIALHVIRSHQRQGIGRWLVAAVAGQLWQEGCGSLMLWVLEENRARGFYERLGGKLLGESQVNGCDTIEVAYGWPSIRVLCG
jgi:ribosomal protein S18 acetylase RimI-like enzyme